MRSPIRHSLPLLWLTFIAASCGQSTAQPASASGDATDATTQTDTAADTKADTTTDTGKLCPANCDDGNPCTDDSCFPSTGCKHTSNDSKPCDLDGSGCSVDKCNAGKCTPGPAKDCDDKLPCTLDTCDATTAACAHSLMADKSPCTDAFACTADETCVAGACVGGSGVDAKCDDADPCTADTCDLKSGCKHTAQPDGTACGGGSCVGSASDGKCVAGVCTQPASTPFEQTYGDAPADGFRAVIPVNGGFGLAGGVNQKNMFVRTDDSGKMLWQTELTETPMDATAVAGDGFAVVGDYYKPGTTDNDWMLERVDATGKILWSQSYGGTGTDAPVGMAALADGFALVGWTNSKGDGVAAAWLVRTDAKGNLLWDKTFNAGDNTSFNGVVALSDGFACVGANRSSGVWQSYLVRTDASGNKLWEQLYGTSGYYGNSIAVLPDGGFALVSAVDGGAQGVSMMRLDAAGAKLWEKKFTSPYDVAAQAVPLTDGFLISIAGTTLVRTDSVGSAQWQVVLGAMPWSMRALGDGFVLAGTAQSKTAGNFSGWLARTDAWGHTSCATSGVCATTPAAACDDSNPCTADLCDPPAGCHWSPLADGTSCGTGKACTVGVCN